jgi:putative CocE/NonD family hydrolase
MNATRDRVQLLLGAKIPMRDGVSLNANIFLPPGKQKAVPAIVGMGPYTADHATRRALYFSRAGFAHVAIDVRGRGNSEGEFTPYFDAGPDGYDAIEWIALQPWCDGKIGMHGGSYNGLTQWQTVRQRPPHLRTIAPSVAARPSYDVPFGNNITPFHNLQWLTCVTGKTNNWYLFQNQGFWNEIYADVQRRHLPFRKLPELSGNLNPVFEYWIDHAFRSEYWDARSPSAEEIGKLDLPILSITGQYDDSQFAALSYYRDHVRMSATSAPNHYLVIGPWDHLGSAGPVDHVGGLPIGPAAIIDILNLEREWFEWTLRDGPKPELLRDRVAYYVTGAEEWRFAASLDAVPAIATRFYPSSGDGHPNDVGTPGNLARERGGDGLDSFVYDPLDNRPIDFWLTQPAEYAVDCRSGWTRIRGADADGLALFGHGLVYDSDPLLRPITIAGTCRALLWLVMDVQDADLQVSLYEIMLDGTTVALTFDLMRVRYRESLREECLAAPGEPFKLEFSSCNFIARKIEAGHRLRVIVTCPNNIALQKNYCSGGPVADESGDDARRATIQLLRKSAHQSYIEFPIVAAGAEMTASG